MNPQRHVWCPTKTCTCLRRLHDQVCAGMPGQLGRVCFNFKTVGGGVFAYDNLNTQDVQALHELVDVIYDQLVARGERGADDSRDGGGRGAPGAAPE